MPPPTDPGLFWVRYEPRRALVSVMTLSPAAELAHRRFSDIVWATGQWPGANDSGPLELARVTPEQWPAVLRELRTAGWVTRNNRLMNPQVARVMTEARAARNSRGDHSRKAAAARWRHPPKRPPQPPETPGLPLLPGPPPGTPDTDAPSIAPSIAPGIAPALPEPSTVKNSTEHAPNTLKTDERLTFSASTRESSAQGEQDFMRELKETLGLFHSVTPSAELLNWGGWWRNRFRENPDKARRVLAEVRGMIRERRIRTNPGAAANDLWARLP